MITYIYEKNINANRLDKEIRAQNLSGFVGLTTDGLIVNVLCSNELSAEHKTTLDSIVASHSSYIAEDYVEKVIYNAADYGMQIIRDLATRNVVSGKTDEQIDAIIENPEVIKIGMALMSGSLKYARRKLQALEPNSSITQNDIDWMIQKLNKFLDE